MKRIFGILMILALLSSFLIYADTVSDLDKYSGGEAVYVADASSGVIAEVDADGYLKVNVVGGITVGDIVTGAEITSLIPGTAATKLGKAEDATPGDGDTGVSALVVRKDVAASTGANGDYVNIVSDADGKVYVNEANSSTIKTAVELIDNAIDGSEMQVDLVGSIPAGSAAIGKLAANSGVDIGDVDVTSVIAGTGATNIGKAEDAAHSTGDTAVGMLGVRQDTAASLCGADGDYTFPIFDASNHLWVKDQNSDAVKTAVQLIDNMISGSEAQVDIVSSALPSGAATQATLVTIDADTGAIKTAIEILDNVVDGTEAQVDIVSSALPSGAATQATLATIDADTTALFGTVDGTELQVDIVGALPAGTAAIGKLAANTGVDIGDVDVTSSALPTGAATEVTLGTIDADTGAIKTAVEILDNVVDGTEAQVDIVAALPAGTNTVGKVEIVKANVASIAEVSGAAVGGLEILAAGGAGVKNRIYKLTLTTDSTVSLAISDGFGTYYAVAGVPIVLDYSTTGKLQTTAVTAVTVTSSGAANVGALIEYSTE